MRKRVSLAIPCGGNVNPEVLVSMLALVNYSARNGIDIVSIGKSYKQLIDWARNGLTEEFLSTDIEWLFWMDSDMTFSKETLVELFKTAEEKDAKIVSGIYYQRKGQNLPALWSRGDQTIEGRVSGEGTKKSDLNKYVGAHMFPHPDKKTPFKAHAAGFGCVLVHRSVFEVMDRPWFKFIPQVCSEDFYFFVNAKEKGFDLWVNPIPELKHEKDPEFVGKEQFLKNASQTNYEIDSLKES